MRSTGPLQIFPAQCSCSLLAFPALPNLSSCARLQVRPTLRCLLTSGALGGLLLLLLEAAAGVTVEELVQATPETAELPFLQELLLRRDLFLQDARGGVRTAIPEEAADLQWFRIVGRSLTVPCFVPSLSPCQPNRSRLLLRPPPLP